MNIKYLAYNLFKTDYKKLNEYIKKLSKERKIKKINIIKDLIVCLFKYNTRFLDYFYFKFFNPEVVREKHTNVWDMYVFHNKYNSKNSVILRNKLLFRERYNKFFNYPYFKLDSINKLNELIQWIILHNIEKLVAKEPMGTVGKGVEILKIENRNGNRFINNQQIDSFLKTKFEEGFTLYETFIEQDEVLANIYPHSINTIRVVTFLNNENRVEIWGALLRVGYDKKVDNFDAGGLSARINLDNGIVETSAKIKDPFVSDTFIKHPITGALIKGVKIPFWEEVLDLVTNSALEIKDVRTVGWDVAISKSGPTLIEGNDNWDKTHFELISEIGLNSRIKQLIK